jgi:hypothetical protein
MFLEYFPGPYEFALTAGFVAASVWAVVAAIFYTPPADEEEDGLSPKED